jgi:hypothetical protein
LRRRNSKFVISSKVVAPTDNPCQSQSNNKQLITNSRDSRIIDSQEGTKYDRSRFRSCHSPRNGR